MPRYGNQAVEMEELLKLLPGVNRRWQITLYRNEPLDGGGTKNVLIEQFDNVRPVGPTGRLVDNQGILRFECEDGREVVVSSMPYIAKEIKPHSR
jgi:hypothetical protein